MSANLAAKGTYRQPVVVTVAPDAIVFIEHKRTIKAKYIDEKKQIQEIDFDFMNYVSNISTTKGIESVPGSASITLNMPLHVSNQVMSPVTQAFSTMQEVEIYMKGRFQVNGKSIYYPVFWGMVSNVSENTAAGNFRQIVLSCQDMMRWLQVTTVNMKPSVTDAAFTADTTGNTNKNTTEKKDTVTPGWVSRYTNLSAMGIIRDLLHLSLSDQFVSARNLEQKGNEVKKGPENNVEITPLDVRSINDKLIKQWQSRFSQLSAALNIYGYKQDKTVVDNVQNIIDVIIDSDAYRLIYGQFMDKINNGDINSLMPIGTAASQPETPPTVASVIQNRLDVANEVKDQLHLEFFQDVDGTIVLKPAFYNMDTRDNPVYVIEDTDIINASLIEDESQVVTRVDVIGTYQGGFGSGQPGQVSTNYGYAIDFEKMEKYGFRMREISSNFLIGDEAATFYATQELIRLNSLILNGSLNIQGRPEIKLGYPVYVPSKDAFYYVTGINHTFEFGGSFDTTLSVTAARTRQRDILGDILKDLGVVIDGGQSGQENVQGKDSKIDKVNSFNNTVDLCNPTKRFDVQRPNFRYKRLDDLLRAQGTFRFIRNSSGIEDETHKTITDNEGYLLIGGSCGILYARDLKLTEDFKIVDRRSNLSDISELATTMQLKNSSGKDERTLRFQQPLTLDQLQSIPDITTNRATQAPQATSIPVTMKPTNDTSNTQNDVIGDKSTVVSKSFDAYA